MKKSVDSEAIV